MTILTKKEREDVYKYWLHSSDEDGLIQLAEKAVLEKLAGMELPEPDAIIGYAAQFARIRVSESKGRAEEGEVESRWSDLKEEVAAQLHQAFAQGAASQLSAKPFGYLCEWSAPVGYPTNQRVYEGEPGNGIDDDWNRHPDIYKNLPLYTLKAPK